eukprot:scaffold3243_cov47-Attheya_sp.AAC.5
MDQLIPIASKLQDVLGALGGNTTLDLPQIVVVGGQSSGKSSVLEGIVGRSFLPRGTGICTRRPLILQLYNTATPPPCDDSGEFQDSSFETEEKKDPYEFRELTDGETRSLDEIEEWGEFMHIQGRKFFSFKEIREEIERDTERVVGNNKGIHRTPIYLKIFSPLVLPLTLVDLPGFAKVAVGDQPEDIEEQIRDMCLEYISNPNAIILAVTGANTDLANSDALQIARQVDPEGERTVGVLTKLDLMDPGTDASEMLQNNLIPLRRGYVGVVNRGQKDVASDLSIRDGLRREDSFFKTHPVYGRDRTLTSKCGTSNLARNLNTILMHHIRECLPELKNRITNLTTDVQNELSALGTPTEGTSRAALGGSLLALLSKFTAGFASLIDGRGNPNGGVPMNGGAGAPHNMMSDMNELYGGARISYIFNDIFSSSLMSVGPFDGLSDDEIRTTICNANGTRPALFVPEISFDILVRRQISRLEQPGIQCVDLVYQELQRIASQCEPGEFMRFPAMRERLVDVVNDLLKRCVGPTQMMVSNLVKIELAYINTSHPDFIGGSKAVARLLESQRKEEAQKKQKMENASRNGSGDTIIGTTVGATPLSSSSLNKYAATDDIATPNRTRGGPPSIVQLPQVPVSMRQTDVPPTDREKVETEIIKSLIESYFNVVRKNFIDMVPKTIMYFLVNHVKDALQNELVSELYRDSELPNLMGEAEDIAQRRRTCVEMKDLLEKALEIVNEVRDFNTFN